MTKVETGGTFWKVVFNRFIFAIIFWQLTMIGVMNLKGAHIQSVIIIPLMILTMVFKWFCTKWFDKTTRYYIPDTEKVGRDEIKGKRKQEDIYSKFGHPAITTELIIPMIHANIKNQLKSVYHSNIAETTMLTKYGKTKLIISVEIGDDILKFQPVEEHELNILDPDNFNMGYAFDFDSQSMWESDGGVGLRKSRFSVSDGGRRSSSNLLDDNSSAVSYDISRQQPPPKYQERH